MTNNIQFEILLNEYNDFQLFSSMIIAIWQYFKKLNKTNTLFNGFQSETKKMNSLRKDQKTLSEQKYTKS